VASGAACLIMVVTDTPHVAAAGAWDAGSSMVYVRYVSSASGAPDVTDNRRR
jgi:hypothetical protein